MRTIEQLQEIINNEILKISFTENPKELYDPIYYSLKSSGKRIRPLFLLLAHQLYKNDISLAIKPAIGIEIFHNFTLIHDDIMDKSELRRNQPTVHKKWNENIAILSGDAMMILSMRFFLDLPTSLQAKAFDIFTQTALQVCEGQQFDMNFENIANITLDNYLEMIKLKTAVLIACSLSLGGIIAEAAEQEINNLYHAGISAGLAFQLQDDLLDVFGKQETFGKAIGNDIIARKKTFLYIAAYEKANESQKKMLDYYFNEQSISNSHKIMKIKNIYEQLNIYNHTLHLIESYINKSLDYIEKLKANIEAKNVLKNFILLLINRKK